MHHRPDREKNCHSRAGGNPQPIVGEGKVQLIMFTYLPLLRTIPVGQAIAPVLDAVIIFSGIFSGQTIIALKKCHVSAAIDQIVKVCKKNSLKYQKDESWLMILNHYWVGQYIIFFKVFLVLTQINQDRAGGSVFKTYRRR